MKHTTIVWKYYKHLRFEFFFQGNFLSECVLINFITALWVFTKYKDQRIYVHIYFKFNAIDYYELIFQMNHDNEFLGKYWKLLIKKWCLFTINRTLWNGIFHAFDIVFIIIICNPPNEFSSLIFLKCFSSQIFYWNEYLKLHLAVK